jgi:hypothetical protein
MGNWGRRWPHSWWRLYVLIQKIVQYKKLIQLLTFLSFLICIGIILLFFRSNNIVLNKLQAVFVMLPFFITVIGILLLQSETWFFNPGQGKFSLIRKSFFLFISGILILIFMMLLFTFIL